MKFGDSIYVENELESRLIEWKNKKLPFNYVEVVLSKKLEPNTFFETQLQKVCTQVNISVVHLPEVDFSADSLKKLKKFITMFSRTGCKLFNIHLFSSIVQLDVNKKIPFLRKLVKFVKQKDVILTLENTEEPPEIFNKVFSKIPEGLNFCLDVGHANLFTNNNYSIKFINMFSSKLKLVHVHDNFGGNSESDDKHLPLGRGSINFRKIFNKLKSVAYDGLITIELPWSSEEERIQSLNFIKKLISTI
ncbi:MAG: sugar phosphate isomerase/epimerase family protein [Candidatus Anstonellales archaeon]